ncbi:hypothetical protein [Paenibacillus sp. YSY-4.3]
MQLLKTVLLLSALLLYLPSQIDATYGEFASFSDTKLTFQACPVFPGVIESRLSDIHAHFQNASVLKDKLQPLAPSSSAIPALAASAFIPTATNAVYLETEQDFIRLSLRIRLLQDRINITSDTLASSAASFQELNNELALGSVSLNHAIRLTVDIPANCARLSGGALLDKLEFFTSGDTPLSPLLSSTLADLIGYLRQVYEAGVTVQNVPNSLTNQLDTPKKYYAKPWEGTGDTVSRELLQDYEASQYTLEAELRDSMAELHVLESRLSAIQAAAEEPMLQTEEQSDSEGQFTEASPEVAPDNDAYETND